MYSDNYEPQTIEELKMWYKEHNLPPKEITRFFIGEDYQYAKAYGIYEEPFIHEFVVYKNKANGQREIRYQGNDERHAVKILFEKLKDEIENQKNKKTSLLGNSNKSSLVRRRRRIISMITIYTFIAVYIVIIVAFEFVAGNRQRRHESDRHYENDYYYDNDRYYDDYDWDYGYGYDYDYDDDYYYDSYDYDDDYYYDSYDYDYDDYSWDSYDSWDSDYSDWGDDW